MILRRRKRNGRDGTRMPGTRGKTGGREGEHRVRRWLILFLGLPRWSIISSGVLAYMKYWCYREPTLRAVPTPISYAPWSHVSLDFTRIRASACTFTTSLLLVVRAYLPFLFSSTLCRRFLRLLSPFAVVIRFLVVLPPFLELHDRRDWISWLWHAQGCWLTFYLNLYLYQDLLH